MIAFRGTSQPERVFKGIRNDGVPMWLISVSEERHRLKEKLRKIVDGKKSV